LENGWQKLNEKEYGNVYQIVTRETLNPMGPSNQYLNLKKEIKGKVIFSIVSFFAESRDKKCCN